MKVKLVRFKDGESVDGVTLGKSYEFLGYDNDGDALITDDEGDFNCLFIGEFEVIE